MNMHLKVPAHLNPPMGLDNASVRSSDLGRKEVIYKMNSGIARLVH